MTRRETQFLRVGPAASLLQLAACTSAPPAVDVQATVSAAMQATVQAVPTPATAAAAPPSPAATPAATAAPMSAPIQSPTVAAKHAGELTAASVLAHLNAAGLPIVIELTYAAETEPNMLLGRPGQHVGKASWRDPRTGLEGEPGTTTGGTVEWFLSKTDQQARQEYVGAVTKSGPFVEYAYGRDPVLLRLARTLTPDQSAEYERALQAISG